MFNKIITNLFAIAVILFILLGSLSVFIQALGLFTGMGSLMIWADENFFKYAVLASTLAGFFSFLYPYTIKKDEKTNSR